MELYYLFASLVCFLIVYMYYNRLYLVLSIIFYIPAFTYLAMIYSLRWISYKVSRFYIDRGRFTVWILRDLRMETLSRRLTNEVLIEFKRLTTGDESMAVKIQKPGDRILYELKSERDLDAAQRSKFYFRKLDVEDRAKEKDKIIGLNRAGRVSSIQSNTVSLGLTLAAFDGWENVLDDHGNTVPYDVKNKKEMFNLLGYEIQDELIEFVTQSTGTAEVLEEEE